MNNLEGVKVGILVANGFEQVEMVRPREALEKAGAETMLISPEKNQVQGWNHFEKGDFFPVEIPLAEAKSKNFDAILLPGGVANPDTLRINPDAIKLIKNIVSENKPIAAICHGPWLLINANVIKGHKITSWLSIKQDLINAGAEWIDQPTVVDDLLLTSRKPEDIPQFNTAMIQLFGMNNSPYAAVID